MAEVLNPGSRRLWPVDRIIIAYFTFTTVLILVWWKNLPEAPHLLALHAVFMAVLAFEIKRPNFTTRVFRNWYPVIYVAWCYKEMAVLVPAVHRSDYDRFLAGLDFRIWYAYPTVWLERIATPLLTEMLQVAYTLFVPAVLLVAFLLWKKGRMAQFQYYAFLIALGFLISYIGYLVVPARGPRFLLKHLQHAPLQGLWMFRGMRATLDRLESAAYDCFPSGHTELTILAWWGSRMFSKRVFWAYFAYTPLLIFATVYLRYHYTVDLLAGAGVACILIVAAPVFYRKLSMEA